MKKLYFMILVSVLLTNCTVFAPETIAALSPTTDITPSPQPSITPTVDVCFGEFIFLIENANPIIAEWEDEFKLTTYTVKELLPGRIANMRRIKGEMEAILPVQCPDADPEHPYGDIAESMDEVIKGYLAYLADEPQSVIDEHFQKAIELFGSD